MTCSLCDRPIYVKKYGWCDVHTNRYYRTGDPNLVRKRGFPPSPVEERFWPKVAEPNEVGCREWTAFQKQGGYGMLNVDGQPRLAHRIAWELANGPIPEGMCVLHSCDNPPCVEVEHLWLGTRDDNNADMRTKGRHDQSGLELGKERSPL